MKIGYFGKTLIIYEDYNIIIKNFKIRENILIPTIKPLIKGLIMYYNINNIQRISDDYLIDNQGIRRRLLYP
jgi:hypothetical protein